MDKSKDWYKIVSEQFMSQHVADYYWYEKSKIKILSYKDGQKWDELNRKWIKYDEYGLYWLARYVEKYEEVYLPKYANGRIAKKILRYKEHRKLKEYDKADAIRDELKAENIQIRVDKDGKVTIKDLDNELFWL